MDITQNVFWFFRGPKIADGQRVWQIENNMTKALVVLLRNTDHSLLLRHFLARLGISYHKGEKVGFALQRRPILPDTPRRIVLCISGGAPEAWDSKDREREGRPDAVIWTDRWTILVESKLGSGLDQSQVDGHLRSFGWPKRTKRVDLTWHSLHGLVRQAGEDADLVPKDRFLLAEWLRYMEDQGMSDFVGWTAEDFRYFDLSEDQQADERRAIQERFERFRDGVAESEIARRIACGYGRGKWRTGEFWFNIGGDKSTSDWHITVYLWSEGVYTQVIVNSKHRNWQLAKDPRLLERLLTRAQSRCGICPIHVTVEKVRWRKSRAYGGQSPDSWEPVADIDLSTTPKTALKATGAYLNKLLYELCPSRGGRSELRLECGTPREKLLGMGLRKQYQTVWDALRALAPLVAFLRKV